MKKFKHKFLDFEKTKTFINRADVKLMGGKRSIGKTTGLNKVLFSNHIKDWIEYRGQKVNSVKVTNVRLVRDVTSVKPVTEKILTDAFSLWYSDKYTARIQKVVEWYYTIWILDKETQEEVQDFPCFHVICIKKATKLKDVFIDNPNIQYVNYLLDELVAEDGVYCTNEVDLIFSVISTTARMRKTVFYGLFNCTSVLAPILCYFNFDKAVSDNPTLQYYYPKGNRASLQLIPEDAFEGQTETEGALGAFGAVENNKSTYWETVTSSHFQDNYSLIKNRDGETFQIYCNITMKGTKYTVRTFKGFYYITDKASECFIEYTDDASAFASGQMMFTSREKNLFRELFNQGRMCFKNLTIKNDFLDLVRIV